MERRPRTSRNDRDEDDRRILSSLRSGTQRKPRIKPNDYSQEREQRAYGHERSTVRAALDRTPR